MTAKFAHALVDQIAEERFDAKTGAPLPPEARGIVTIHFGRGVDGVFSPEHVAEVVADRFRILEYDEAAASVDCAAAIAHDIITWCDENQVLIDYIG